MALQIFGSAAGTGGGGGGTGNGLPSTVVTKTAAYTAAAGEFVQANTTTAGFTVTLPTAPATGALVSVKKVSGDTNTLTIAAAGGGTIDGAATATTVTQWAGVVLEHTGSNVWRVAASMSTTGPAGANGANGTNGTNGTNGAISVIQDEGTALTVRSAVNFVGAGVTASDDAGNGRTTVTIPGGSGVALLETRSGGHYIATPGVVVANLSMSSAGFLYVSPIAFSKSVTLDRIGLQVTQLGAAGSTIRLGIYADDGSLRPAALILDAGTIAADTTGRKELTISQALGPGMYWLGASAQSGTSGSLLVQGTSAIPIPVAGLSTQTTNDSATASVSGFATNGAETGALPGTITTLTYNQAQVPRVFVRVS